MNYKHQFIQIWLLLLLTVLLTACQRGSSSDIPEIEIELTVSPNPPSVGQATVTFTIIDEQKQPVTGAAIELEGNMNHAGMTPVFSQATEVGDGQYEAPLEFTMGGDWFILVKVNLPDGRKMERQIDVPGVQTQ